MIYKRLVRIVVAAGLAVAGLGALVTTPAQAVGESFMTAESLGGRNFTKVAALKERSDYWFFIRRPGGGRPLAFTLQIAPVSEDIFQRVDMFVTVRFDTARHEQLRKDFNKDAPGLVRLGMLTRTNNTGLDRKFYINTGSPEDYFLRLVNNNSIPVSYALTVERREGGVGDFWKIQPKEFAPLPNAASLIR